MKYKFKDLKPGMSIFRDRTDRSNKTDYLAYIENIIIHEDKNDVTKIYVKAKCICLW